MKKLISIILLSGVLIACAPKFDYNKFITEVNEYSQSQTALMIKTPTSQKFEEQKKHYADVLKSDEFKKWNDEANDVIEYDTSSASKEFKDILQKLQKSTKNYVELIDSTYNSFANAKNIDEFNKDMDETKTKIDNIENEIASSISEFNKQKNK